MDLKDSEYHQEDGGDQHQRTGRYSADEEA